VNDGYLGERVAFAPQWQHACLMGRTANYSDQRCSVAATLEVIGDPWTMLILRDAFKGVRRFEQWQAGLGVARNVLAARLRSLTDHGVLAKRAYCERPPRHEYVLTAKGKDLFSVVMVMLDWGDRHIYGQGDEPRAYTHLTCGHRLNAQVVCQCCGGDLHARDVRSEDAASDARTVGQVLAKAEA
jgi:DNA-binding HxlR family transcriptional regulator